jgi:membrane-associated PAP2 superfamily phosphatase
MTLFDFLSGAITLGFLVAALFFLRFWRRTRDGLFLAFAIAFTLLGIGQAVQALANIPQEERSYLFLIRLAAFTIILAAIVRKNRSAP